MRSRSVLLVVAILLVAGFAALNWSEIIRPTSLLFGPVVADAPLGAILLGLLALSVLVFTLWAGGLRTHSLMESRHHMKELEAQRSLADKAEASRFTELRTHIDNHLREMRERDAIAASELEKSRLESQRELRAQMEQINRTIAARLNELEHRLDSRFDRGMPATRAPVLGQPAPARTEPMHPNTVHEHAEAQRAREAEAHQAQMRDEERLRDERLRQERERANASDRPAESGWRRWF